MCIIIAKPKGKRVPMDALKNSLDHNPHGIGVAWAENKEVKIKKGITFEELLHLHDEHEDKAMMIHLRYATVGGESKANCHPFRINKGLAMAHNGTIRPMIDDSPEIGRSDSRVFAEDFVIPMVRMKPNFVFTKTGKNWMKLVIEGGTNKLCFLSKNGKFSIVNKHLGEVEDGIWYSTFRYTKPKIKARKKYIPRYGRIRAKRGKVGKATQDEILGYPLFRGTSLHDEVSGILNEDYITPNTRERA